PAGEVDDFATGECLFALKSAEISGLTVNAGTLAAVRSWSYTTPTTSGRHPTETGYRLLARIFSEKRRVPANDSLAQALVDDLPRWEDPAFEHWQIATFALFQHDGPGGRFWGAWHQPVVD